MPAITTATRPRPRPGARRACGLLLSVVVVLAGLLTTGVPSTPAAALGAAPGAEAAGTGVSTGAPRRPEGPSSDTPAAAQPPAPTALPSAAPSTDPSLPGPLPAPSTTTETVAPTAETAAATTPTGAGDLPETTTGAEASRGDPGAQPIGSQSYPVPPDAVVVDGARGSDSALGTAAAPYATLGTAVSRAAPGSTIVLRAGSYHESVSIPSGKALTVQPWPGEAVWLDGSRPVGTWVRTGDVWVSPGWTAAFDTSQSFTRGTDVPGFVPADHPLAADPQQLFVDGGQFEQVPAGTTPGPGQFAVDTAADTLTVGQDPTGHDVRASDLSRALTVAGPLTLRGIGIRRYATPVPDLGAVLFGGRSAGSLMSNVVVQDNATQGVSVIVPDVTLEHVTSRANGMTGVHANNADRGVLVESLLEDNNTQHFADAPSAGGVKVTRTRGFEISRNVVRDNLGVNGIWVDESVVDFVITGNRVVDNGSSNGIVVELSARGLVAGNTVSGQRWGIMVLDAGDLQILNNAVFGNVRYQLGLRQDARREATATSGRDSRQPRPDLSVPWITRDITVSNNAFGAPTDPSGYQVLVKDDQTNTPASAMNILITGNAFTSGGTTMLAWGAADNTSVTRFTTATGLTSGTGQPRANTGLPGAAVLTAGWAAPAVPVADPVSDVVARLLGLVPGSRTVGPWS